MLCYTTDTSYIGRTADSVEQNLQAMLEGVQACRRAGEAPMCLPELGILALAAVVLESDKNSPAGEKDALFQPRAPVIKAMLPLLENIVQTEAAAVVTHSLGLVSAAQFSSESTMNVGDAVVLADELLWGNWICHSCRGNIANFHVRQPPKVLPGSASEPLKVQLCRFLCPSCLDAPAALMPDMQMAARFYLPMELDRMLKACQQHVGAAMTDVAPADAQQTAEDERIELRIEELRALLPLQAVLNLPGMKQARKNPSRAASSVIHHRRSREENRRQLRELEAAWVQHTAQATAASVTLSTSTSESTPVAIQVRNKDALLNK
jgi:hypothetical protein